jgi:uncharacterized membrane protein
MSGVIDDLIEGLNRLKSGALIQLIAFILIAIGLVGFVFFWGFVFMPPQQGMTLPGLLRILSGAMLFVALIIIAWILSIIAFYYWYSATGYLRRYNDERLGIGRTGMTLILIALVLLILVVGGIFAFLYTVGSMTVGGLEIPAIHPMEPLGPATNYMSFFIAMLGILILPALLGGILLLVGMIMFSIMLMRLGDMENVSSSIHTAGILFIIAIILSIIPYVNFIGSILHLIGIILIYSGAGETISRLS